MGETLQVLTRDDFPVLLKALQKKGYRTVGPMVRDGAIIYDELNSVDDLPIGMTDEHNGGSYRLHKRNDEAFFGYVVGPHSWKKFLFPPNLRLWSAKRNGTEIQIETDEEEATKYAFIAVRACELQALSIQDKVFINGHYTDPYYKSHRENLFIVAVNCSKAGGTCFCASMNTGPQATFGYDLAMTEVLTGNAHYFVVDVGSKKGEEMLKEIPHEKATPEQISKAKQILSDTAAQMGRSMDTTDIKDLLYRNYENPRWEEVAERCLTCANCTLVCPTCLGSTVEDVTDLRGEHAERWRKWDSCFTKDFSYVHGGSIRTSAASRYRQWMTHKLATWIDQFGTSGCVGCGRCITWCPVGIDITEELSAIRESEVNVRATKEKK